MVEIIEVKVLSGTWLYDDLIKREVHIVKSNFKAGSGDYEDEPDLSEDQYGEFYGVRIGEYRLADSFQGGAYNSLEEAKIHASNVCPSLNWNIHESNT